MNKPDKRYLKTLYKGLLTASLTQRIQVLSQALQWYDDAIEYVVFVKKVRQIRNKNLSKAQKARELGISTKNLEERETAFRTAIRGCELYCEKLRPPRVDKFYSLFTIKKKKLVAKDVRLNEKHAFILRFLSLSTKGSGLKLKVIDNAQKPRQFNGENEFGYSADHVDKMRRMFRKEGLLPLVVQELPYLTRAMALSTTGSGGFVHDPKKQNAAYEAMLNSFVKFCNSVESPKRLVKRRFEDDTGEASAATPREKKSRRKVGSGYTEGSCIDFLYRRLENGKPWDIKDLFKGAPSDPKQPLQRLVKHGTKFGEFEVKISGDVVQLIKTK